VPGVAYAERSPAKILRPFVVCSWTRDASACGSGSTDRILPDGCVDIVWDGHTVFVAGPDTRPVLLEPRAAGLSHAGVRFRPGVAPAFLQLPACDLRDQRVPLDDIWGASATRRLTDVLAAAGSTTEACDALERQLVGRVGRLEDPVDDLVRGAVSAIATTPSLRVNGLAARLGVTDRTLHRRVLAAVGYGPKVLQRVARFRRFLASAHRHDDVGLAGLAGIAGYADQPHLSRECNALAGLTPLQLVRGSDVRLVQDGLTRSVADCEVPSTEPGARS
jgi:AraC-like DNA-binding protein